jgi:hypothetical protein
MLRLPWYRAQWFKVITPQDVQQQAAPLVYSMLGREGFAVGHAGDLRALALRPRTNLCRPVKLPFVTLTRHAKTT